jgi:hypothetical protein
MSREKAQQEGAREEGETLERHEPVARIGDV